MTIKGVIVIPNTKLSYNYCKTRHNNKNNYHNCVTLNYFTIMINSIT